VSPGGLTNDPALQQKLKNKKTNEKIKNLLNIFFLHANINLLRTKINSDKGYIMSIINLGDLVTLKGMAKTNEKPLGMVKRIWATRDIEIFWLNEEVAKRYALTDIISPKKLEIVSKANQQSS
tara:strand:+ start:1720 stop:2088 length:369 start_codon:yes stop_codon:yes gene_type:complete